ncbi:MAG: hypothetical protein OQK75_10720 [Gammaproteobacteria bacterium]|nr:hypothetical protein [Gammaproteobacteria bacterium]MCW9030514.1 hypothetical protein [Gammaproteobacteria bacterium]
MSKGISIESMVNTFYKKGEHCDYGCHPDDIDKFWDIAADKAKFNKNVYAVKNWIWCDVSIEDNKLEVVKADYVLRSNNRQFDVGDWVRTSPIINFTDNCICETSNSFYILVGKGTRKNADESIFSFFG